MLLHLVALTAPLFLLVLLGYVLTRFGWPRSASDALTRFVFTVAVPTLLFRLMSDFSRLPRVDARLLIAFFGGCLVVYAMGRALGASAFRMDGATQSVFAMGGIFSNNVLLGIPLAKVALGTSSKGGSGGGFPICANRYCVAECRCRASPQHRKGLA